MNQTGFLRHLGLAIVAAGLLAAPLAAQIVPTADLLVPYFTVDLGNPESGDGTLFAVTNHGTQPAEIEVTVFSNWGIAVLVTHRPLKGDELVTVNMHDWLVHGELFDRQLGDAELAHLQAALTGKPSPQDHLYYGSPVAREKAVGYVTIRSIGPGRRPTLWGDFFTVGPTTGVFQADTLVNIDRSLGWNLPCKTLGIRFLDAAPLDTHLVIWSPKRGVPSSEPTPPDWLKLKVTAEVYDEPGNHVEDRSLALLPVQVVELGALKTPLAPLFGWLELQLDVDGVVTGDFNVTGGPSGALHAYCLPLERAVGPAIGLEKLVNGQDADVAPGPIVPKGSTLVWTFLVNNSGSVPLYGITLSDDSGLQVTCPDDQLEPGASMTCNATSSAEECQRSNVATVLAQSDDGPVEATDSAFYFGQYQPALSFGAITINGNDARTAPGPSFPLDTQLVWLYQVVNSGDATLSDITVQGAVPVSCPRTTLLAGETMTCTSTSTAKVGAQTNLLSAQGTAPCGDEVVAAGSAYYTGTSPEAGIAIQKLTNGEAGDVGTGPVVLVGSRVEWTYVVTNVGAAPLSAVAVVDDQGPVVSCPKTALAPGESMTCTASGVATLGQYRNVATVIGTSPTGTKVTASDSSQYYGVSPAITIEKLVNGFEADTPPGPTVTTGGTLLWTYVVTNSGTYPLTSVVVTDDQGLDVTCPKTALAPGESMTCTATSTAIAGQHVNLGTVTASWGAKSGVVTASDPANYFGQLAQISIAKRTNGVDADLPPGPSVLVGTTVSWTYVVSNGGDATLSAIAVTDSEGVTVTCPKTSLQPGESMTCTATGTAVAGQYMNVATVVATPPSGPNVSASDTSHYLGLVARVGIEKLVNGHEADTAPGPSFVVGTPLLWTYVVTNLGDVQLIELAVTDNRGVAVTCPKTVLAPAEAMTCTGIGVAVVGQQSNIGTATGRPSGGSLVTASDPCFYVGFRLGTEGCTPGYWKNHCDSWPPTGYTSGQRVESVFSNVNTYYPVLGNATLLQALGFGGGSGGVGAAEILLRAGVAALLNSAHPGVDYPRSTSQVIADVNGALLQNRDAMLALAAELDADNNLGCPLN